MNDIDKIQLSSTLKHILYIDGSEVRGLLTIRRERYFQVIPYSSQ